MNKKMGTVVFGFIFCSLIFQNQLGESKSVPNLPLPPVSENKIASRQLELLVENGNTLECTTKEEIDERIGIRNGIIDARRRWSNFSVFLDPAYSANERTLINNAMFRLSEVIPCVNFGIYPPGSRPSGDYINIRKSSGCWSYVGKLGGAQDLSLQSPGCMSIGTIMHELMHALGFYHEQSSTNRDDYVNILWENIIPGTEHNFRKLSANQVTPFGVPYNTRSIMHYRTRDFSKNGQPTITTKTGGAVGSTGELQQSDIEKLKKMYNC